LLVRRGSNSFTFFKVMRIVPICCKNACKKPPTFYLENTTGNVICIELIFDFWK
jgi:hypothetical protein